MDQMEAKPTRAEGVKNSEIYSLFSGKEDITSEGKRWELTLAHVSQMGRSSTRIDCMTACLIFHHKPDFFLVTGKTKRSDKGDGVGVLPKLLEVLPRLSEEEVLATEAGPGGGKFKERRSKLGDFGDLNLSMIHRIALLTMELNNKVGKKFHVNKTFEQVNTICMGKTPTALSEADILRICKGNVQTASIYREHVSRFTIQAAHWESEAFSTVFSVVVRGS